jgi:aminoacyl-tRNA hydrolase
MSTDRTRPSSLRRLSHRLELWRIRHAASEASERFAYWVGARCWPRLAPLRRRLLTGTTFIAVTGSCGKSTTRLLIEGAVGATRSPKVKRGANLPVDNAHAVWLTRRSDRHAVFEVSVGKYAEKDMVKRSAAIIRPDIVVVTNIRDDHISAFGSREAIAREKGDLVEALGPDGIAVLNADDPLVMAMRARCRGRVITFGTETAADVRAEDVSSRWPNRLSFRVLHGSESAWVETQLCGTHWVAAALAAIAAAVAAGVPLAAAAAGLRGVPPFFARMSPQTRADGVTFVRDDVKAPLWTVPASLAFLADADAPRTIAVIGTISDYVSKSRRVYTDVASQAVAVADQVIFVGGRGTKVLRSERHAGNPSVRVFNTLEAAHAHLSNVLRAGDLVLLKGSQNDLLYMLALERFPYQAARAHIAAAHAKRAPAIGTPAPAASAAIAIIGLGNDGDRYAGTRHNVGFACIERLARRAGAVFDANGHAYVARVDRGGAPLYLIKPRTMMNAAGSALVHVVGALALTPSRCILVHDDVDYPVGRVKGRMQGGAGGHRGVRSVLEAFEDHRFPRVKIGIGKPPTAGGVAEYVVERFPPGERDLVDRSLDAACEQALLLASAIERGTRARDAGADDASPASIAA